MSDFAAVRAAVWDANLAAHGLDLTVCMPTTVTPVEARGIWCLSTHESAPGGMDLKRRDPTRILALSRTTFPTVPRGTRIVAPEVMGGTSVHWTVDGLDRLEADHHRVIVVRDQEA